MMSTTEKVLERPQLAQGSLLDEIMAQTRIAPSEEGYDIAKKRCCSVYRKSYGFTTLC